MRAYTEGPWEARRGLTQMCDPVNTTVATVGPAGKDGVRWWVFSPADDHGDPEATAKLVAAAPELLEACQQALMQAEDDECTHGRKFGWGNVLREAIAKALLGPPPPLCNHDDPSWCDDECDSKREAFKEYIALSREGSR